MTDNLNELLTNELNEILTEETTEAVGLNQAQLLVYNDDFNTFDWVIQCFMEVCNHTFEQSEQLSLICLLYTSPSPRDKRQSRMPSSA